MTNDTKLRTNRELKAHCPDFRPVRQVLRDLEARFIEVKDQVDHYYNLPPSHDAQGTRRLKLRIEKGRGELIYYQDLREDGARTSNFQLWQTHDPSIGEVLDAALGTKTVVHKQRELWGKDNAVFNLNTVERLGQVLEAEVQHTTSTSNRRNTAAHPNRSQAPRSTAPAKAWHGQSKPKPSGLTPRPLPILREQRRTPPSRRNKRGVQRLCSDR